MAMGYRSAQPPSISPATSMQPDSVLFRFLRVFALLSAQFPLDLDFAKCEEFFMRIVSRKAIREATAKHSEWGALSKPLVRNSETGGLEKLC